MLALARISLATCPRSSTLIRNCRLSPYIVRYTPESGKVQHPRYFAKKSRSIKIDRSGLLGADRLSNLGWDGNNDDSICHQSEREELTPLAKDLISFIKLRGPISLHDFMSQTSNHLVHGYYQLANVDSQQDGASDRSRREVIGEDGDFVTAPEISQIFGEMIAVWCITMWQSMGEPNAVNLIELGPGKGTLMKDILRVSERFPAFRSALRIHLVELSSGLRLQQRDVLQASLVPQPIVSTFDNETRFRKGLKKHGGGRVANDDEESIRNIYISSAPGVIVAEASSGDASPCSGQQEAGAVNGRANSARATQSAARVSDGKLHLAQPQKGSSLSPVPVTWHSFLHQVPDDAPVLVVGQEFLDAFPVHQFVFTEGGWKEKLVDAADSTVDVDCDARPDSSSSMDTPSAADVPAGTEDSSVGVEPQTPALHFRFVLSPGVTPAARSLLRLSPSASASPPAAGNVDVERSGGTEGDINVKTATAPSVGDGLEISPLAIATCEDIARLVSASKVGAAAPHGVGDGGGDRMVFTRGGAALLVDYGEDMTQEDSLRGYYKHHQVHVLSKPGLVDLTADVDFSACRGAAQRRGAHVPGVETQGHFLVRLGAVSRVEQLLEQDSTSEEQAQALVDSLRFLLDPAQMGRRFKVMAVVHPALRGRVLGFDEHTVHLAQEDSSGQQVS